MSHEGLSADGVRGAKLQCNECVMLQCEFDSTGDVFSGDIKDTVFNGFYNIAVNVL